MIKNNWRHLWEIPNANYYFCGIPLFYWPTGFKKMGAGDHISKMLAICRNGCFEGFYDPVEFDLANDFIFSKMKNNFFWVKNSFKKIIKYNLRWIKVSKKFLYTDFKKLSNKQLVNLSNQFFAANKNAHITGLPLTYNVDADELVTTYLINYLDKVIVQQNLGLQATEIFSLLSAPLQEGNIIKEQKESLKICLVINKSKKTREMFKNKSNQYINKNFDKIERKIKKKILKHHERWCWLPYNYEGPAWNLDYFLNVWRCLIKNKINFKKELIKIRKDKNNLIRKKKEIYKKIKIDKLHKFLFWCAEQIIYLKGFRKDVSYFAYYCQERFWVDVGRRLNLPVNLCRQMLAWEVGGAILKGECRAKELSQRRKFSLMYTDRRLKSGYKIYLDKEAKKFLTRQKFEKIKTRGIKEIKGSCAEIGKVTGKIKIINAKEDVYKMKRGDILVAANTSPDLLPAMKKASAIITDQGGLTCHAAIVARELKIPCIIGTKIATQVLKDGDLVEVDANNGVVKKIK